MARSTTARCRAVVDGQVVAARVRPALFEAERVVDLGAAEAVDRLVLIRDAEHVAALAGEQLQEPLLRDVRVLVLVDEDEAEGALVGPARLFVALEQRDSFALEPAVVERPARCELGDVSLANGRELVLRNVEVVVAELGEPHRLLEERARPRQPQVLLRRRALLP